MYRILSDKLLNSILKNADSIVCQWIDRLKSDPAMATFTEADLNIFKLRARELLVHLEEWAGYDTDKLNISKRYEQEGIGLFNMGIPLCDGMRAIILLKRMIWLDVTYGLPLDTAIELRELCELNDGLTLFFDRAEYFFIKGYTEEMNRKLREKSLLSNEDVDKILFGRSFSKK